MRALPTRHDPGVHHPRGLPHEVAVQGVALGLGDVGVGRERNRDLALLVHDARVGVAVPVVVGTGETLGGRLEFNERYMMPMTFEVGLVPS